jgi:hypothetical protein
MIPLKANAKQDITERRRLANRRPFNPLWIVSRWNRYAAAGQFFSGLFRYDALLFPV